MSGNGPANGLRELICLSGKGGTGKTTLTAALLLTAHDAGAAIVGADCDVDAANLNLALGGRVIASKPFVGGQVGVVDPDRCSGCGRCQAACQFGAVTAPGTIESLGCEGCGVCAIVCPGAAISLQPDETGELRQAVTGAGPLIDASLRPGRGNSGKLVAEVRRRARRVAHASGDPAAMVLSDGPPGLGCPVISALTGADLALLVTEPSISAARDLSRTLDLCRHFAVPAAVVINKADLAPAGRAAVQRLCDDRGAAVWAEIPFDPAIPLAAPAAPETFRRVAQQLWPRLAATPKRA